MNRMVNKRRILAVGNAEELDAVRITDGHVYDRYERKKQVTKKQ